MQRGEETPEFPRGKAREVGRARERGEHARIAQICCAGVCGPASETRGERGEMRGVRRHDLWRSGARWRRLSHRDRHAESRARYAGGR
jgi:hypothetical protein